MSAYLLGIDIAKAKFDVAFLSATLATDPRRERPRTRQFDNTVAGIAALLAWLPADPTTVHACLEATSTYGLAVADALTAAGATVSVVNPYRVKHYAQSELQRSKTDRVDAGVIARFCRSQRPEPWTPPTPQQRELQGLVGRLADLQQMRTQEKNRKKTPGFSASFYESIDRHLADLETEMATIQTALDHLLETATDLHQAVALLTTIPGIGRATALHLLAELGDITRFRSARSVAAYAGLVPAHRQSGTSLQGKPRLSKQGSARLRYVLFHPALVAIRRNQALHPFIERLAARGKTRMAIVGAVMHKLIRIIYGVLRSGKEFSPSMT